ncbi:MAG: flagellar basal body rod protein FlgC [Planctomycetaceae bacterium]|nr:flagellar basal body rod protein FlgC [Planctomycetaceae bacterium]
MFTAIDVSTSGLVAQRARMDTIAGNIANAQTTRDADGKPSPFRRRFVTFEPASDATQDSSQGMGVRFEVQVDQNTPPRQLHQPGHPDADAAGFVSYPAIDLVTEFVNAMEAGRAYEANVTAMEMSKEMSKMGLRILA